MLQMSTVLQKADLDSVSKVIDNSDALLLWYSVDLLRSMGGHIKTWYHRAILFANANQEPVTVRKERYVEVLNKLWGALGLLSRGRGRNRVQRDIQCFQQDGAPPHTANITLYWLDHKFSNRLISRKREPEWSPHSPDLTPQISTCGGS